MRAIFGSNWKTRVLSAVLLSVLGCWPHAVQPVCTWTDPFHTGPFTFAQLLQAAPERSYFFLDYEELYRKLGGEPAFRSKTNLEEWQERFCNRPRLADIRNIVYEANPGLLKRLRTAVGTRDIPLPPELRQNSFARYLKRHGCTEAVDYLLFAKSCEPHVTVPEDQWEKPQRNVSAMMGLVSRGQTAFYQTESHYFRLRYAYQLIRLAHYAGEYELALELYDELMPRIDHDPSLIEYWILGHRAGALYALGQRVEAAYLYSRVFAECPGKRESALRSFKVNNREEWTQLMLRCRTYAERATLHAMRAFSRQAKVAEEMLAIYELDPRNPFLEILLVREIKALEPLLRRELPRSPYRRSEMDALGNRAVALQQFARLAADNQRVANPLLWRLSQGYLEVLRGDYYAAERTFKLAEKDLRDRSLEEQLRNWRLVNEIMSWETPSSTVEERAYEISHFEDAYEEHEPQYKRLLQGKMNALYLENGNYAKALMSMGQFDYILGNPQPETVADLLKLVQKPDPNIYERELMDNTGLRQGELLRLAVDLQATHYLANFQLEAALETMKMLSRTEWERLGRFYPFVARFTDCVHCTIPDTLRRFNKGQMIEELLELEYKAKADPDKGAQYFYYLGIAFYNFSYFGFEWKMLDPFRSGISLQRKPVDEGYVFPHPDYPYGNLERMSMAQATYYFEKARILTKDRELAVKATYWLAKCERNQYYADKGRGAVRTYAYFDILKENYSDLPYYQRIIRECLTFRAYAQN